MRIPLRARYFHAAIDLTALRRHFGERCTPSTALVLIDFGDDHKVCVTGFGCVVFWNFEPGWVEGAMSELGPFIPGATPNPDVEDRLIVLTEQPEKKVLFNEIWLAGAPTIGQVKLISLLLARSVALDHRELEVDRALAQFEPYMRGLRESGRTRIRSPRVMRSIGFAMETRHAVLAHLSLFDKPDATWESEELEWLYTELFRFFELDHRQRSIGRKLDFLRDNMSLMFDVLSTGKSLRLEWAIVLLIVFEILLLVVYEMVR